MSHIALHAVNNGCTSMLSRTESRLPFIRWGKGAPHASRCWQNMFKTLSVGNLARIQDQIGNHPLKWNRLAAIVVEVRQFAQYLVRVDCSDRTTLRNHQPSIQLHSLSFLYSDLSSPNPTHVRAQGDPSNQCNPQDTPCRRPVCLHRQDKGHAENRHPFDFYSTSWNNPAYWIGTIVRRKSHFKWNCCTDFFCQLILVHNGLRQHFPEGVQNFVQWHFLKSNMAAATSLNH